MLLVSVTVCSKPLTTWKSKTSLYTPPAQPSRIVSGALLQLLILIASLPYTLVSLTVNPAPFCPHFRVCTIALGSLPGKVNFFLLIISSSPGFMPSNLSIGMDIPGVGCSKLQVIGLPPGM